MALFGSLSTFLVFLTNFWHFFDQNGPNFTFYSRNVDILCIIHTKGIELYGKMALFVSLGLFIQFWQLHRAKFGPLKAKISQIARETPTFYWPPTLCLTIGI